jgi:hypothetical protein
MELLGIIIPLIMGAWLIQAVHKGSYGSLEADEKQQARDHRDKIEERRERREAKRRYND